MDLIQKKLFSIPKVQFGQIYQNKKKGNQHSQTRELKTNREISKFFSSAYFLQEKSFKRTKIQKILGTTLAFSFNREYLNLY